MTLHAQYPVTKKAYILVIVRFATVSANSDIGTTDTASTIAELTVQIMPYHGVKVIN